MDALLAAVYTKITGSTLSTLTGGRIYTEEAPENTAYPYITIYVPMSDPEYTFTEEYEDSTMQFTMYSSSAGLTEITGIYNALKSLFDECSLSISGSTLVWCRRATFMMLPKIKVTTKIGTETVRCWTQDYNIKTSLN